MTGVCMDVWEHVCVCVWVWLLQSRVTVCIVVLYPHVYRLSSPQQLQDSAELIIEAKSNIHRQRLLQPIQDYQINELPSQSGSGGSGSTTAAGGAAATSITPGGDKEQASSKHLSHDEQSKPPRGGLKKVSSVRTHTYTHTDTDKHTLEKMKKKKHTHIFCTHAPFLPCLASHTDILDQGSTQRGDTPLQNAPHARSAAYYDNGGNATGLAQHHHGARHELPSVGRP